MNLSAEAVFTGLNEKDKQATLKALKSRAIKFSEEGRGDQLTSKFPWLTADTIDLEVKNERTRRWDRGITIASIGVMVGDLIGMVVTKEPILVISGFSGPVVALAAIMRELSLKSPIEEAYYRAEDQHRQQGALNRLDEIIADS